MREDRSDIERCRWFSTKMRPRSFPVLKSSDRLGPESSRSRSRDYYAGGKGGRVPDKIAPLIVGEIGEKDKCPRSGSSQML
jgi:hypothetical protein